MEREHDDWKSLWNGTFKVKQWILNGNEENENEK